MYQKMGLFTHYGADMDLFKWMLGSFDEHTELEYLAKPTPKKSKNIKLSCSL